MLDRTSQKTARTTRRIKKNFTRMRINSIHHESGNCARRVVFTRIASGLQVVQYLLVDVTEVLTLGEIVEVDPGNLVDDLPHQLSRLHVVIGVLEYILDDTPTVASLTRRRERLKGRE